MAGLVMHAVVYVVVNTVIVFGWMMTVGSRTDLETYIENPSDALTPGFWPIFIIVVWGAALVIHAAAVLVRFLPGSRHRRRRARAKRADDASGSERGSEPATATETSDGPAREWVVVMFTDISLSTPLTESMGDDAWAEVLASHRATVRELLDLHGGREVSTQGDGFLVRFPAPDAAADCASDLQRQLARQRAGGTFTPEVRIGIHAGEVLAEDRDLVGSVVNQGARVADAAGPGEILVTESVADQLPAGHLLTDAGLHDLKGLSRARHLLRLVWQDSDADLGLDSPATNKPDQT